LVESKVLANTADSDLLERFVRHHDEAAFITLLGRHGPMVLAVSRRILAHEHDAEDVYQAVFLLLACQARSIRKHASVGSWLHGVARRLAVRARNQANARTLREGQAAAMRETRSAGQTAWRELQAILDEELARLPENYRAAVVMCCLEARTQEEAAQQLGCPLGTVRSRLARGRKLLHDRLTRRGLALSAGALATALTAGAARSNVPAALVKTTRQTAVQIAAGQAVSGFVAPSVASLMDGGTRAIAGVRGKLAVALLLTAGMVSGVGLTVGKPPTAQISDRKVERLALAPDAFGDPLFADSIRRIGTLRFRHGGGNVSSLLVSPDGKTLVSTADHGSRMVFAWELATGKLLHKFPGHPDYTQIALSADGKMLATCQRHGVVLWDLASGRELRSLQQPFASGVAFSPDGKTLASADDRNPEIVLWDIATGTETRRVPRKVAAAFSPARVAFSRDGAALFSAKLADSVIEILDLKTGKQRHVRDCLLPWYPPILSPNSDLLAIIGKDGAVPLWDASANKLVRTIETGAKTAKPKAFSSDGKTLLIQELGLKSGERVSLWDVTTGNRLCSLDKGIAAASWFVAAFSNDGKTLITNGDRRQGGLDSTIRLWDSSSGEERGPALDRPYFVAHLTLAPNGKILAYAKDRDIQLLDAATGQEIGTLSHGPEGVTALAFSPDGRMLASCEGTNTIRLWDVRTRQLLHRHELVKDTGKRAWIAALAYSPDGKTFAAGGVPEIEKGGPSGIVWICDAETGRELRRFLLDWETDGWSPIMGLAFLNTGKHLAAVSRAHEKGTRVTIWETATGKRFAYLTSSLNLTDEGEEPKGLETWEINRIEPNIVPSPDGRLLARNGHSKILSVWETASGKRRCILAGHQDSIFRVAFAPDGRTLASASADETIRLWDLATGKELRRLAGHRGIINSLVFSADGKTLISAGHDTTILFWDVAAVTHRLQPLTPLTPAEQEAHWDGLAAADAVRAHDAIARLVAAGPSSVTYFRERLQPATEPNAEQIGRLVRDLGSEEYTVRTKASKTLEELGDVAETALRRAMEDSPSAEVRRRAEPLLTKMHDASPSGEPLRSLRAIEVLERIATPEARRLIQKLADGAPDARLTREARAVLARLAKQSNAAP
jgi:RNA polymerase sigma factor (sigma-70 family)